jgi:hypothetical protein
MKTHTLILITAAVLSLLGPASCTNSQALKIITPAVQAQILGDVEKDVFAGGGALLISGGNSGAAVAALTAQEVQNIPALQKVLAAVNTQAVAPVTVTAPAAKNPAVGMP